MPQYTVIGLYDDEGQTYAEHFEADGPYEAMTMAADANMASDNPLLEIIGAIAGKHELFRACEDSGKAAFACDMVSEPAEDED